MANGNPFYVQQADIAGPVLSGLSAFAKPFEEKRIAEAAGQQQQAMLAEISNTFQTGTPDEINLLSIKYPEQAKSILAQGKFHNEQTQQNYLQSMMRAYQNPEQIGAIAKSSASFLRSQGASDEEIEKREKWEDKFKEDPEQAKKDVLNEISFWADKDQWERFKGIAGVEGGEKGGDKQKTGAFLVRDETGATQIAVGVFDPSDGTLKTETSTFGAMDVVSKLGETGPEESARKVGQVGGETMTRQQEMAAADLIKRGVSAAESTATTRRALELLDKVETGGIDAVKFAAKRLFGVEGADPGELSASLGKAVLSQLRETFGAQFTQEEGNRLIRIEAGFGKSVANNKRLLKQALRISERTAGRARRAAKKRGDTETVADIDDLLTFSLSVDAGEEEAPPELAGQIDAVSTEDLMAIALGGR